MKIVENTLAPDLDEFLDRPLFCFLAQTSETGPRVSPLWYLWEDGALWMIAMLRNRSYPDRINTGLLQHVGFRGRATLEPFDEERATRLLGRYLGDDEAEWDERFCDLNPEDYRLVRVEPETVVARDQSYIT